MSFSYLNNPLKRTTDAVRLETGDTLDQAHLIEDEEIAYALDKENSDVLRAAARLSEALAARFAREETVRISGATYEKGSLYQRFRDLAKSLRARITSDTDFVSNLLSASQHSTNRKDTTIVQPAFRRGMHAYDKLTTTVGPLTFDDAEET